MKNHHRTIRSYVRRSGRITTGQKSAVIKHWSQYGIDFPASLTNLDEQFSKKAPLSIEIGFGDGVCLVNAAQNEPNLNHLGIEVYQSGIGRVLVELNQLNLENVKIINADAVEVMKSINDASVSRVLILFPDPWPKKKHHKRRLLQTQFVDILATKIKPQGILHIATDWLDYANHILELMQGCPLFENLSHDNTFCQRPDYRVVTKFQRRGEKLGHGVYDLIYKRVE